MPAWGFPYTSSDIAAGPAAATLLSDALAQNVIGGSFYAWWNSSLYAELGAYTSLGTGTLKSLGVDPAETSRLRGYYEAAKEKGVNDVGARLNIWIRVSETSP